MEGETNPLLKLEAGKTYNFTWINADGEAHNVVITDAEDNVIIEIEIIISQGERQSVGFPAPEEGGTYYCEVHSA